MSVPLRKPSWLKVAIPAGGNVRLLSGILERRGLHTVCDEARCPNKAECWGQATATFMIMGAVCTRGCRFCAVDTAKTGEPLRPEEPAELAEAVAELGLKYAVVTSVDRDDLPDRGAGHFSSCVRAIKERNPAVRVEVLVPDYHEGEIGLVLASGPEVLAHNVETVERLEQIRDQRASYRKSLATLSLAASWSRLHGGSPVVKSSLLLGLGEREEEILSAMDDLRAVGVTSLVLGQYLRPTIRQLEVAEYISPERFDAYARAARERGFISVIAAPLARTSYHARAAFDSGAVGTNTEGKEAS